MFADQQRLMPIQYGCQRILSGPLLRLVVAGGVAVLWLLMPASGAALKDDTCGSHAHVREFAGQFYTVLGRVFLDGLMVSDGSRSRIAVYWVEPAPLRDNSSLLRYSDFLFVPEGTHVWIYGVPQAKSLFFSAEEHAPFLPRENSVESAVRSALAILTCVESQAKDSTPLALARFFQNSRRRGGYTYEVLADSADANEAAHDPGLDARALNKLPYGRKYAKETKSDGTTVWRATRALNGAPVVAVTVRPMTSLRDCCCCRTFDPDTLGAWALIPSAYRAYWSFDRAFWEASASPDKRSSACELYDRTESYPDDINTPSRLCRAWDRLRVKTAMMTEDINRIMRSVQAAVAGFCHDESMPKVGGFLELAEISGQIEERYPAQAEQLLRPLVCQMVGHMGRDAMDILNTLVPPIEANRWFLYGKLLLEEVRRQGVADGSTLDTVAAGLDAARLAGEREPPDPCEASASVRQYLAHLDGDPPTGTVDLNDLRRIMEKGLTKAYENGASEARDQVVEDTLRSIRLVVGEGPFRADPPRLLESVDRFVTLSRAINRPEQPVNTVLATFLALSFCDISTVEDHNLLLAQFRRCSADLQSQVNRVLRERGLCSLVSPQDVASAFDISERTLQGYIQDPLCPAFKFPWTRSEETRLANKVKLRLLWSETSLREISLRVKYGGNSAELKRAAIREISFVARGPLLEGAFLRQPSYPGVSCCYRDGYGLTALLPSPLYEEGDRPREKFQAMKYFHLGHRLEDVVERERELARSTGKRESNQ
jgi:hypothetical protein